MSMNAEILNQLIASGQNITLTISAHDLREFADSIAQKTGRELADNTIKEIKRAMGDPALYCSGDEVIKILGISRRTLDNWIAKKHIIPCKVGAKNLYLREEIIAIKERRGIMP